MSSEESSPRRRPRPDIEEDEDADVFRAAQRSTTSSSGSKRVRTNGYRSEPESELESEPESPAAATSRMHNSQHNRSNLYDEDEEEGSDDGDSGQSEFQPGSIIRVKLTNFVTYENAEFFPGPNLNMVIGPNGTGKSSLVCAICLGLGWGPQHLGRAGQVGEFVKHGADVAVVEIELQKRPEEASNHVVKLRIIRDGNQREWFLKNKKVSLKAVQALTRSLSIQIDNLCQFLPQDKVSEFAALSPVDLLLQTQRAAAPEEMLEWHDGLKIRRKEQKTLEHQQGTDKEILENLENRQQNLQAEVRRLEERQEIQEKVTILHKKIPFVEYRTARDQHIEYKKRKDDSKARLKRLKERVEPLLASVHEREANQEQIKVVIKEREQILKAAEGEADKFVDKIEALDEDIKEKEAAAASEHAAESNRRKDLRKFQQTIRDLEARLNERPIDFNAADWNDRIRAKEQQLRDLENRGQEMSAQHSEICNYAKVKKDGKFQAVQELADFESQEGQRMNKIELASKDTAAAWRWVQDNRGEFEKEVYGPPIVSCSIKDPKYTDAVEAIFQRSDFLAITAQTSGDWNKLRRRFFGEMKLGDVTIKSTSDPLSGFFKPRVTLEDMQRFGFDCWALDLVDGPEPVLSMLCASIKLHTTAIGFKEISENQHAMIVESGAVNSWVAGRHSNKISKRAEYGSGASSTTTKLIHPAKYWTDRPVDASKRQEIQSRIDALDAEFLDLKKQILPMRERMDEGKAALKSISEEAKQLRKDKAELQKAFGHQQGLPGKIEREKESLALKQEMAIQIRKRLNNILAEHDDLVLRKAQLALGHTDVVARIRSCHEKLLDAKIRLIEVKSDIDSLNERNRDINDQVKREEDLVQEVETESKRVKGIAARALAVCQDLNADPANAEYRVHFAEIVPGTTVESLEMEIAAEESKLEFIHANNPNAIRDFEKRQVELEKLKEKMAAAELRLGKLERYITRIRSQWEPELDKLIAEISEAFSYNFEQIGCAGEVSVHKDDDFEQWAIQIKVKFRENETLQLLDQHRQSGGERSVSTIFYLMSLQSLARAPFRVVDEINQGMDPRNERMVHERMVEIACKEHTSQYFLITPKLLTGLRYDKRMKVLCIASGEHMPENYKKLDLEKIIGIQRAIMAAG